MYLPNTATGTWLIIVPYVGHKTQTNATHTILFIILIDLYFFPSNDYEIWVNAYL